jgi:hypothetical protein
MLHLLQVSDEAHRELILTVLLGRLRYGRLPASHPLRDRLERFYRDYTRTR